ncbi:hypothetical protein IT396_01650 [Candidatus Nomurabacteria bacterium]|nr:hypothetical protein [Candidatus Nomurabacteria bacterium]
MENTIGVHKEGTVRPVRRRHPITTRGLSSLDEIRKLRESQAPGEAYRVIRERLADATKELLLYPTNHPWPVVEKAVREGILQSRVAFGAKATSIALKNMGLEKFDPL